MNSTFLNVRLSEEDKRVMEHLQKTTGLTKSVIVKRALRSLASAEPPSRGAGGLFELGAGRFGRHTSARRQAADIKRIARARALAKRTGR